MRSDKKKSASSQQSRRSKLNNKRKKQIVLSVLFLFIISLIGYVTYFAFAANKTIADIQGEELTSTKENPRPKPVVLKDKEPFSVLLLGVDERVDDSGRSDTIIVATVNPDKDSVKLVSIPRDTLVTIPGHGKDKVNAAYAYGGVNLAVQTVEDYLDIPINYYTKINMEGMIDLVDAVGGIHVDNKYAFELDGVTLATGTQDLDGTQALQYARMRKQDPAGDFGRQERQKEVITKIAKKALGIQSVTNFNKIFNAVGKNVETNFSGSEIWELLKGYSSVASHIENLKLEGPAGYTYYIPSYGQEVYVWEPSADSLKEVSNELREHLNLKAEKSAQKASSSIESTNNSSVNEYYQESDSYEPYVAPEPEQTWDTPTYTEPEYQAPAPDTSSPNTDTNNEATPSDPDTSTVVEPEPPTDSSSETPPITNPDPTEPTDPETPSSEVPPDTSSNVGTATSSTTIN